MSQSTARVGVIRDLMLEHFEGFLLAEDELSATGKVARVVSNYGVCSPEHYFPLNRPYVD
jgi:hypothetical protein